MDLFNFIADPKFKTLLERDFNELERCIEANASKAVLILSGSIIEAMLVEFFLHTPPSGKTQSQVLRMNLADLIDEAQNIGLINAQSKELSTVVRNYRNLIHPGVEIRKNENFDHDSAAVAYHLLKLIIKQLGEEYSMKYGYKAQAIFDKIMSDSSAFSIFDSLLAKMGKHEIKTLLSLLIDYNFSYYNENGDTSHIAYIDILKKKSAKENILGYCKELLLEVERGQQNSVIVLFEIFGSDIDLLTEDEQGIILSYIYDLLGSCLYRSNNDNSSYLFHKFGYNIGSNLLLPLAKTKFFSLLETLVYLYTWKQNTRGIYVNYYHDLVVSLPVDTFEECKELIVKKYPDVAIQFYESLDIIGWPE